MPHDREHAVPPPAEIDGHEENALRYAAGYVVRSVRDKLLKCRTTNRDAMLCGLSDMCLPDDVSHTSETWLNAVDRGGLVHINHTTFKLFYAIEMELRNHLTVSRVTDMNDEFKYKVKTAIFDDVDVKYYMDCVTEDLEDDERKELLEKMVNLYITVRGFSFVRSWLEMYKQAEKVKLQKSKSLRNKLSN